MLSNGSQRAASWHWAKKTSEEKRAALSNMAADLAAHAERHGNGIVSTFELLTADQLDDYREVLLSEFDRVLGEPRTELLEDLRHARPADRAEKQAITDIRRLLLTHPDFPTVSCDVGHVTGSALIVDGVRGELLLRRHRKLRTWGPVGGHPEFEVNMLFAAFSQAYEAINIAGFALLTDFGRNRTPVDVDLQQIPATPSRSAHLHADFRYVFATPSLERLKCVGENDEFRIVSFPQALAEDAHSIEPSVKRLIAKAQALVAKALAGT